MSAALRARREGAGGWCFFDGSEVAPLEGTRADIKFVLSREGDADLNAKDSRRAASFIFICAAHECSFCIDKHPSICHYVCWRPLVWSSESSPAHNAEVWLKASEEDDLGRAWECFDLKLSPFQEYWILGIKGWSVWGVVLSFLPCFLAWRKFRLTDLQKNIAHSNISPTVGTMS